MPGAASGKKGITSKKDLKNANSPVLVNAGDVQILYATNNIRQLNEKLKRIHLPVKLICLVRGTLDVSAPSFPGGHVNLSYNRSLILSSADGLRFEQVDDRNVELLVFCLDVPFIDHFFYNEKKAKSTFWERVNPAPFILTLSMKHVIYDIIKNGSCDNNISRLWLYSKIGELLALQLQQAVYHQQGNPVATAKEIALAGKVKVMLDKTPGKMPFTIISMAAQLDTNETTLKNAFKKVYGTPVFADVMHCRMGKAQRLCHEGYEISEVSKMVGYSHVSHFSTAYKKYVGVIASRLTR